ncbi:MAG: dihydrolipoyl dehydrogenase [Desulfobacteraceae bacterium]
MYDLAVIGGGPGGYVAAIRAAQKGLKTALVEQGALGGTCLNRGCIPTKSFVYDSKLFHAARTSSILQGTETLSLNATKMIERKRKVVKTLVGGLGKILKSHRIEVVQGMGHLEAPGKVRVTKTGDTNTSIDARHVILANGSRPAVPPFIDIDGQWVQTTDQALDTEAVPDKLVIIGGGVIGIEMATIYLNLCSQVTIVELLDDVLTTEDEEVRKTMRRLLKKRKAAVHLKAKAKEITPQNGGVKVVFEDGQGAEQHLQTDRVLVATGRAPVLTGIDSDQLKLQMNGPYVQVNGQLQTNLPGVYAIGDLVGGMMLAHKASAEGEVAIDHILGHAKEVRPELVPRCIWGLAEIGAVGLTEKEARATGRPIKVGTFMYRGSGAAQAMGEIEGFTKVVGDAENGEILGVHIMGEHATDLISEAVSVMKMEGAVEDLYEAIKPHPTVSETVLEAALDWNGLAIHAPRKG